MELRRNKEKCFKIQLKEQNPAEVNGRGSKPLGRCNGKGRKLAEQKQTTGVYNGITRPLHIWQFQHLQAEASNNRGYQAHSAVAPKADSRD